MESLSGRHNSRQPMLPGIGRSSRQLDGALARTSRTRSHAAPRGGDRSDLPPGRDLDDPLFVPDRLGAGLVVTRRSGAPGGGSRERYGGDGGDPGRPLDRPGRVRADGTDRARSGLGVLPLRDPAERSVRRHRGLGGPCRCAPARRLDRGWPAARGGRARGCRTPRAAVGASRARARPRPRGAHPGRRAHCGEHRRERCLDHARGWRRAAPSRLGRSAGGDARPPPAHR